MKSNQKRGAVEVKAKAVKPKAVKPKAAKPKAVKAKAAKPAKRKSRSTPAAEAQPQMSRRYSKDKTRCRVTFKLPKEAAADASSVALAGSFNDWSSERHPMKRSKNGDYSVEIELETGKEYEFRFVVDGRRWENAWNADKYVWSDLAQGDNSVIVV